MAEYNLEIHVSMKDNHVKAEDVYCEAFTPNFYDTQTGQRSLSIEGLLETGTELELDPSSINVFLRTGMYIGDQTPFRSVRAMLPDPPILQPSTLEFDKVVDAYIDLFRQAMAKCLATHQAEPFTMGLSGGRDSRHILLEAVRSGVPPEFCWSICSPSTMNDALVAKTLTERCNVKHELISAASGLEAELALYPETNFCSLQHVWMANAHTRISEAPYFYDGIAGDVLSESSIVTRKMVDLVEQGLLDQFADALVSQAPVHVLRDIQLPDRSDAIEHVIKELSRHLGAPNPVASFYLWNRTRRDIAESTFSVLTASGSTPKMPFLEKELFSFLYSLPPSITVGTGLHSACIRKAYPEFSDIKFASKTTECLKPSMNLCVETLAYLISNKTTYLRRLPLALRIIRAIMLPSKRNDAEWITTLTAYFGSIDRKINLR